MVSSKSPPAAECTGIERVEMAIPLLLASKATNRTVTWWQTTIGGFNVFDMIPTTKNSATTQLLLASAASPTKRLSGMVRGDDAKTTRYFPGNDFRVNTRDPKRLLIGTQNGLYESMDRGDTVVDITPGNVDRQVTAIAYGGGGIESVAQGANVLYAGTLTKVNDAEVPQLWWRSATSQTIRDVATYPGDVVTQIVLDPLDAQVVYVLDNRSRIWRSRDNGRTWSTDLALNSSGGSSASNR